MKGRHATIELVATPGVGDDWSLGSHLRCLLDHPDLKMLGTVGMAVWLHRKQSLSIERSVLGHRLRHAAVALRGGRKWPIRGHSPADARMGNSIPDHLCDPVDLGRAQDFNLRCRG